MVRRLFCCADPGGQYAESVDRPDLHSILPWLSNSNYATAVAMPLPSLVLIVLLSQLIAMFQTTEASSARGTPCAVRQSRDRTRFRSVKQPGSRCPSRLNARRRAGAANTRGCAIVFWIGMLMVLFGSGFNAMVGFFSSIVLIAILGLAILVLYQFFTWLNGPGPDRVITVTRRKDFFGNPTKEIQITNTGKSSGRRANSGSRRASNQACRSCGATVSSTDGSYHCSCGRIWGRR